MGDTEEREKLLAKLQSYGQEFLSSFSMTPSTDQLKRKKRKIEHTSVDHEDDNLEQLLSEGEEWHGFSIHDASHDSSSDSDEDHSGLDDSIGTEIEDNEFNGGQSPGKQPEVVVFSGPSGITDFKMSRQQTKLFMSSKVSKLKGSEDLKDAKSDSGDSDIEEERTNLENDALLHKLVHTQLLSSDNRELDMTPAQRRRAMEGRLLELAGSAKVGKGEFSVRQDERRKASRRVRSGLERKVQERKADALQEAKNLGNYHQSIKHLFDTSHGRKDQRKRERGLKLGVGRFSGGVLKLSRDDIASVQDGGRTRGKKKYTKRK